MAMWDSVFRPIRSIVAVLVGLATWAQAAHAMPDLYGPWQIETPGQALTASDGSQPPLLPAAHAAQMQTQALYRKNRGADPAEDCLPPGVPRVLMQPFPFNLIQGRRTVGMTLEWNHLTRIVYMDRPHFTPIGPLYLGQSIGHWDGDTLVIDTNHYNDTTWLDDHGLPHSEQMTTIERLRLIDGGRKLENQITITDPEIYSRPWTARLIFAKRPGVLIKEDYCLGRVGKGRTQSQ